MKLLVLDNYDSFTYNLVFMIRDLGFEDFDVIRNDQLSLADVDAYDKILLSPGPGLPASAGIMLDIISTYSPTKSILGICLGHQGIGEVFGSSLFNLPKVLHGVAGEMIISDTSEPLFAGVPNRFKATHYHSWAIDPASVSDNLIVMATDSNGLVMGAKHPEFDVKGLQFHPESVLTEHGDVILKNWLKG